MDRALLFVPLFVVNVWHVTVLLVARRRQGKVQPSISESALVSERVLCVHRAVHLFGALCLVGYGLFLAQQSLALAVILCAAAVFDTAEAFLLNKKTEHGFLRLRDKHQLSAWLMAFFYLLFAVSYAFERQLPWYVLVVFFALLAAAVLYVKRQGHKQFWVAQMAFFFAVSAVLVLAAVGV